MIATTNETEAPFPKARLEALADYYEHVANSWLQLGESRTGLMLRDETMDNARMLRQAIAAHAVMAEHLRVLGEGFRFPVPAPGEDPPF